MNILLKQMSSIIKISDFENLKNEEKVLFVLENIEGEISINELSDITGIKPSNLIRYWKPLHKDKLIGIRTKQIGRKRIKYLSKNKQIPKTDDLSKKTDDLSKMISGRIAPEGILTEDQKLKRVEYLKGIISFTQITLGYYIEKHVKDCSFVRSDKALKDVFPQMSDSDIRLIVDHYKAKGYQQKRNPGVYDNPI